MNRINSSPPYIKAVIAAIVYNFLHMLAWELPLALRQGWMINIIGDYIVLTIIIISILLIAMRKNAGLILAAVPAFWAVLLQWLLVYVVAGYREPNGVWWYPLFPIFQGIMIIYFAVLAYRGDEERPEKNTGKGLRSPAIYLYAPAAFLLAQTGQKFVRELVVGFLDYGGIRGVVPGTLQILITVAAAVLLIKRVKLGLALAFFAGSILLIQPLIYHIVLGKPCLGGIWWYPFFTAVQGVFIVYSTLIVFLKERNSILQANA